MLKANLSSISAQSLDAEEIKYVKIVVFDDQNRVLAIKNTSRFVLPSGCIEWDDDDAEAAARREVFETTNISLGLVKPVTVINTKDHQNQIASTLVFVGRMPGKEQTPSDHHRFMNKKAFLETSGGHYELVRSLIEAAYRVLTTEEIKGEYAQTAQFGREKYNFCSLL